MSEAVIKSRAQKNSEELLLGDQTFTTITNDISGVPEQEKAPIQWKLAFALALSLLSVFVGALGYLIWEGTGIWGVNAPIGWGWAIINFVWWVGIGHAGTLISAILHLFRQNWRNSINRFAETMTLFAVICALIFPGIHIGRIWVAYWFFPLPNQMAMWPNFRSPLIWDFFAVFTYFTVSLLFWYTGLIPDLATLRDRAKTKLRKKIYGFFALGWRGGNRQWQHYELAYLVLAGISTPLVLSVHSVVSSDFATSVIPGWHTTIFPPYFVAGAIYSGFGMVMTLAVAARSLYNLKHIITISHLDKMAQIMLLTGSIVGYSYAMEFFISWYSGNPYESYAFINRALGPYWWAYWTMIFCNVILPQFFWFKRFRTHVPFLFIASILVNIGMWFERFVIVVISLHRDYMPSAWAMYSPTIWDIAIYLGTFGIFFTGFLLFLRFLPMASIAEVKLVLPESNPHHGDH